MATSSISRQVKFKSKHDGRRLVTALDKATQVKSKKVVISKPCKELKSDDMKKFASRF